MIGLCLAFETQNNYGTQLQAYATIKAVKKLGYECEIIVYHKQYKPVDYFLGLKRLFQDGSLKSTLKLRKKKKLLRGNSLFATGYSERKECVYNFKRTYLFPYSRTYTGFDALCKGAENYSTIMSGSDQVWLPQGYASKFYTMMFVPNNIPKISYASSFGVSDIPNYHRKEAREFLNRLDFISVREVRGKELVEKYSSNKATVVVDPTLLINSNEWEKLCVDICKEPYIFCYFLGTQKECREQAKKLSEYTGLKIIVLKHLDEYIPEDESFGDEAPYNVGPEKFISYIKNATYVLTDSFHGTVFSTLFEKQFMTFYRFKTNDKMSKNSRIDSLLGQLGLMERIYKEGDILEIIDKSIDYGLVQKKLSIMRNESQNFLKSSLERCQELYDNKNRSL